MMKVLIVRQCRHCLEFYPCGGPCIIVCHFLAQLRLYFRVLTCVSARLENVIFHFQFLNRVREIQEDTEKEEAAKLESENQIKRKGIRSQHSKR